MIKLGEANISSDYTHYGQVTTDHKFVGLFINEAAMTFSNVSFVINENYAFTVKDKPEWFKFEDFRKIKKIGWVGGGNDDLRFIIEAEPKTKTKKGFVNIYVSYFGARYSTGNIYEAKEEAEKNINDVDRYVTTTHIEWEEKVND